MHRDPVPNGQDSSRGVRMWVRCSVVSRGVVGLLGVIFNLYKPQFNPLLPGAVGLQALGFIWMAVVFFFFPSKLVASFSS